MVFSSLTFLLIFLPLLFTTYFVFSAPRWRNGVLLVMSLLFYGWGEPLWILAMLISTFANFFCARSLTRTENEGKRKLILALGVVFSLSFLFYFKYSSFFANSVAKLLGLNWSAPDKRLPIGISFYTFQILTYTVDVYRKKAPALENPLRLLLYISCFPQLIAGPIVQYADVADQLAERQILPDDFTSGMQRFIKGLAKKVLLANVCGAAMEELKLKPNTFYRRVKERYPDMEDLRKELKKAAKAEKQELRELKKQVKAEAQEVRKAMKEKTEKAEETISAHKMEKEIHREKAAAESAYKKELDELRKTVEAEAEAVRSRN